MGRSFATDLRQRVINPSLEAAEEARSDHPCQREPSVWLFEFAKLFWLNNKNILCGIIGSVNPLGLLVFSCIQQRSCKPSVIVLPESHMNDENAFYENRK